MKLIASVLLAASPSLAFAEAFEFSFWPPTPSFTDRRIVAIHDGPCGPVATARVERMPEHSKREPLAPERVLELGPKGNVINEWRVPVDAKVLGLAGHQLFFSYNSQVFRVGTGGAIAREKVRSFSVPSQAQTCDASHHFNGSGYAACWRHRDGASGKVRLLAYEGPCT